MPAFDSQAPHLVDVFRSVRAIILLLLGGPERADALLSAALMREPVLLKHPQNFLLCMVDQAKAVSESMYATPHVHGYALANDNDDAAKGFQLLSRLPFDRRLAYTLVEVAGFTLQKAACYCRETPGQVQELVNAAQAELAGAALAHGIGPSDGPKR
ncbi:hypothetical protein I6F07_23970 [Ensifer sp. IC4062]|nr:hypothetical protein [Ensifer sp. IC4062]MCA1443223.1 hypothetical protein [Ensifer sp. IC4062]